MEHMKLSLKKDRNESKPKNSFPKINRYDIMQAILSVNINDDERTKLSNTYSEILYMEKNDLKYIIEIAVSTENDSEIYEILRRWKTKRRAQYE